MKDKDAIFEEIIKSDLGILRGAVYRILGNVEDTDDVIQDALLKGYSKFDSFRKDAELRSWLYRIAVNCAYDMLRRRRRERSCLKEYQASAEDCVPEGNFGGNEEDNYAEMEEALCRLPSRYRTAVTLVLLGDCRGEEAAKKLGCSVNSLYQLVYRGKQMLNKMLKRSSK